MESGEDNGTDRKFGRRALLIGGTAAAAGLGVIGWSRVKSAPVFVCGGQRYGSPLATTIRDGLLATGFEPPSVRGKRVLLKPNLVEPTRDAPHMTTHPAIVLAAAEVFRGWDAEVIVGEGPGHLRDTDRALVESGLGDALKTANLQFADLNYEDTAWVKNRGRASELKGFHFPRTVVDADLIVSLPKMKTHHWVGVTASMKNLYGTLPGIRYGWPKNVLHQNGIPQTVFDINASLGKTVAIVDGIECMEGDGPIMGTPKNMGLVVIGACLTAVDATAARLMDLDPHRIDYLRLADRRLGPVDNGRIIQRGERWQVLAKPFHLVADPQLQRLLRPADPSFV
jgi:uncharacterized protein (DUF362 family)